MLVICKLTGNVGDKFSSIESHAFEWSLQSDPSSSAGALPPAHTVLRFLAYSESSYVARAHIREIEAGGRRGDRILVRGIKSGSAVVSVKMADPVYKVRTEIINPVFVAYFRMISLGAVIMEIKQFIGKLNYIKIFYLYSLLFL